MTGEFRPPQTTPGGRRGLPCPHSSPPPVLVYGHVYSPAHTRIRTQTNTNERAPTSARAHTRVAGVTLPLVPHEGSNRHVRKRSDVFGIEYAIVVSVDGPQRVRPENIQRVICWRGWRWQSRCINPYVSDIYQRTTLCHGNIGKSADAT